MALSHVLTLNWTRSGEQLPSQITVSDEAEENLQHIWASAPTDVELSVAFAVNAVSSIVIKSTENCTLETNDGTNAADTITLQEDKPLFWYSGCGYNIPFTTDVTSIFLTSAVNTGTIDFRILHDGTP